MEYLMEYPSSDKPEATDNLLVSSEPEFFSPTLDERLRSDEAFLKQSMETLERRRAEAELLHRSFDEKERLAAIEANRRQTQDQAQQRNEKEQKLLAEIEALRDAEAEQRQRIEETNAASRQRFAAERTEAQPEPAAGWQVAEDQSQLAQLDANRIAAESEADARATERVRLNIEIKTLGEVATQQIDRMDEAKSRLTILEQIRVHAEKVVFERAEREIRLEAEIEALHQTEALQVMRIEEAEAESRRLAEQQTRMQEAAEARQKAAAEARQQAAAEALPQLEEETRRLADEEEQRLEHLQTIRARAEAASLERTEREGMLNSQLLAFSEAAAEQLHRIEKAEAEVNEAEQALQQLEENARQSTEHAAKRLDEVRAQTERLSEEETQLRRVAEEEEERIVELESLLNQAQTKVQHRREEERQLRAEIEALNQIEAEQLNRIADAEVALLAREEELQNAQSEVNQKGDYTKVETKKDSSCENQDILEIETNNLAASPPWLITETSDQSSANGDEEVEVVGVHSSASALIVGLDTAPAQNWSDNERQSTDSLFSKSLEAESKETTIFGSMAQRLRVDDQAERANAFQELTRMDEHNAFTVITGLFDHGSEGVRNDAARALYQLSESRGETFTRALREATPEGRSQIIRALDSSGLAAQAIESLAGESREKTYDAFSVLFLMAKAGEVQTLLQAIEKHSNSAVRLSVIKLLTFSNRPEIIPALRSLAVRGALPSEVRSALMESIYEISNNARERDLSAA